MGKFGYEDNFFERRNFYLKLGGLSRMKGGSKFVAISYYLYSGVLVLLAFIYLMGELLIMNTTAKNLFDFLGNLEMFFTHFLGILKLYVLTVRNGEIEKIMNLLESNAFKYESLNEFRPYVRYNEQKIVASKVCTIMISLYSGVGFFAHMSAVLDLHNTGYGEEDDTSNRTCQDFLTYYSYIPFELKSKLECHFLFLMVDVQLGIFAIYISVHDMTYASLVNCLKAQMNILGEAVATVRERTLVKLGLPLNFQIFRDEDYPLLENEIYREIRHCTRHLMVLISAYEKLENLFSFVMLGQTMVSLMVMASCLYTSTSVPLMSPIFFSQGEYLFAVLSQFTMFCWYGNELALSGERVQDSLFQCDWLSSSTRFKKTLILNHRRLQRSLYLSIGKFTPLKLSTLISVMRASFSYFAVFKSIE